jgi:hypothetical protein
MAMIDTGEKDEAGHPICRAAMTPQQAFAAAMQGLSHACYTFWPDVILFISGFFLNAGTMQLLRDRRHTIVILHTESPYQDEEQLTRGQLAHLNLLNDPANLDRFRQYAVSEYMPHAYRPAVHHPRTGPLNQELAADLAFIGTAFKSRVEFFEAMDLHGLDVLLGGNDWGSVPPGSPLAGFVGTGLGNPDCVNNDEAAEVYRNARAGLNFYRRETEDGGSWHGSALGPREVEMAACGLFFLRDPRPEGDELFPMLPAFAGPGDASEKLRWWLKHDQEREAAAEKARLAVADRTFENNAKRFLKLLERI